MPKTAAIEAERQVAHVVAVDAHGAAGDVVEPRDQVGDVVLPAPLGPTSAASWPGSTRSETSWSARAAPCGSASSPGRSGTTTPSSSTLAARGLARVSRAALRRDRRCGLEVEVLEDAPEQRERLCTSTETWRSWSSGNSSRVCSVVNATSVPAEMAGVPAFELQAGDEVEQRGLSRRTPDEREEARPIMAWRIWRSAGGAFSSAVAPDLALLAAERLGEQDAGDRSVSWVIALISESEACVPAAAAAPARPG